jgi:uncharacterized protein
MRNVLTLLLSLAASACSSPAPANARPAMWKLSDPDTTIYLFGTVHVLPEGEKWRTPRLDAAIADSKQLVLEITDQGDKAAVADIYKKLAISPGLPPVLDRVPPEKRGQLEALIKKAGLQPAQLDPMETWAIAITLGASMYGDIGASSDHGVEKQLTDSFSSARKPISGLETTAQQLGYFDTMGEEAQRKLLISMIEDAKTAAADFRKMIAAWSAGDVKTIARTFDDELKATPEVARILIDQRNAKWVEWLKIRMHQPGTVMVAVGAGHLAGKGSVIDLLAKQGLKAQRVQ